MSYRPPYTGKDANHFIPRDFMKHFCGGFCAEKFGRYAAYTANYRGVKFLLIDTSAFGGSMPDWILENVENGFVRHVEIKTPEAFMTKNNGLKPAEVWLQSQSGNFRIVTTETEFENVLLETMKG